VKKPQTMSERLGEFHMSCYDYDWHVFLCD
jgi:hypothetical protein